MTTSEPEKSPGRAAWLPLALMGLLVLALSFMLFKPVKVLPELMDAPRYALTGSQGNPVSTEDLAGKVVVYDFIYTHCTTVCPAMTGQMLQLQRELEAGELLGEDVVLVTVTFDPERDTPARLAEYARQVGAGADSWLWLTGDPITIKQLVGGEFGVYFEQVPLDETAAEAAGLSEEERAAGYDFIHSTLFVIVDGDGVIRAEYQQMLDLDQTLRDIRLVVREENAGAVLRPILKLAHAIRAYP